MENLTARAPSQPARDGVQQGACAAASSAPPEPERGAQGHQTPNPEERETETKSGSGGGDNHEEATGMNSLMKRLGAKPRGAATPGTRVRRAGGKRVDEHARGDERAGGKRAARHGEELDAEEVDEEEDEEAKDDAKDDGNKAPPLSPLLAFLEELRDVERGAVADFAMAKGRKERAKIEATREDTIEAVCENLSAAAILEIITCDDGIVSKLVVDGDVDRALTARAGALAVLGELVPDGGKKDNSQRKREITRRLKAAREHIKPVWEHFKKEPNAVHYHGQQVSVSGAFSQNSQGSQDSQVDNNSVDDNDDDGESTSKARKTDRTRAASQSSCTSSVSALRDGRATTALPSFFLPTEIQEWKMEDDPESEEAKVLFLGTTAGLVNGGVPEYASEPEVVVFDEAQVQQFTFSLLRSVAKNGLKQVLHEYPAKMGKRGKVLNREVDEIWPSSEIRVEFGGFQAAKRVDLEVSARNSKEHAKVRVINDERAFAFVTKNDPGMAAEYFDALDDAEEESRLNFLNENVAMIECKRVQTLDGHEPLTLKSRIEELLRSKRESGKRSRSRATTQDEDDLYYGATKEPVAQLCMYLVGTGIRYGALTDGVRTFFVYRCAKGRTIMATDAFYTKQDTELKNINPGGMTIGQAWLVFLHRAIKDRPSAPRKIDIDWLRDKYTNRLVNLIEAGEIRILTAHAVRVKRGADGEYVRPLLVFENKQPGSKGNQAPVVVANVMIGPNLMRDGMMRVLGGEGTGYAGIDVNGVPSFLKTTFSLRDSGDALHYEGCVYAKLRHLQGDAIPEVTAFGKDPRLELTALATKQSGVSLARVAPERFDAYGGALALYYKAASALTKIHDAGFTHGDVALRNIVVDHIDDNCDGTTHTREDPVVVRFIDLERARETRSETRREEELDTLAELFGIAPEEDVRAFAPGTNNCAHRKPGGGSYIF